MTPQEWCDQIGINLSEGARRCGLRQNTFWLISAGHRIPRAKTMEKLRRGSGGKITLQAIFDAYQRRQAREQRALRAADKIECEAA